MLSIETIEEQRAMANDYLLKYFPSRSALPDVMDISFVYGVHYTLDWLRLSLEVNMCPPIVLYKLMKDEKLLIDRPKIERMQQELFNARFYQNDSDDDSVLAEAKKSPELLNLIKSFYLEAITATLEWVLGETEETPLFSSDSDLN